MIESSGVTNQLSPHQTTDTQGGVIYQIQESSQTKSNFDDTLGSASFIPKFLENSAENSLEQSVERRGELKPKEKKSLNRRAVRNGGSTNNKWAQYTKKEKININPQLVSRQQMLNQFKQNALARNIKLQQNYSIQVSPRDSLQQSFEGPSYVRSLNQIDKATDFQGTTMGQTTHQPHQSTNPSLTKSINVGNSLGDRGNTLKSLRPKHDDGSQRYSRPYPGYAFEFPNIDKYTQKRQGSLRKEKHLVRSLRQGEITHSQDISGREARARGKVMEDNDTTFDSIYHNESDTAQPRTSDNYNTISMTGQTEVKPPTPIRSLSLDPMNSSVGQPSLQHNQIKVRAEAGLDSNTGRTPLKEQFSGQFQLPPRETGQPTGGQGGNRAAFLESSNEPSSMKSPEEGRGILQQASNQAQQNHQVANVDKLHLEERIGYEYGQIRGSGDNSNDSRPEDRPRDQSWNDSEESKNVTFINPQGVALASLRQMQQAGLVVASRLQSQPGGNLKIDPRRIGAAQNVQWAVPAISERYSHSQHITKRMFSPPQAQGQPAQLFSDNEGALSFNQQPSLHTSRIVKNSALSPIGSTTARPSQMIKMIPSKAVSTAGGSQDLGLVKYGIHNKQKFVVNKKIIDYQYQTQRGEFTEDLLTMSGGNRYHEGTNMNVGRFINGLQGNISQSIQVKTQMKENSQKIFDLMKREKIRYHKTLVKGEDNGHCKGIKKRLDPTTKYRLKQQMEKYKQVQEERMEIIRTHKLKRDKEKLEAKRHRIQDRLNELGEHSILGAKPNTYSFQTRELKSSLRSRQTQDRASVTLPLLSPGEQKRSPPRENSHRSSRRVQIQVDNKLLQIEDPPIEQDEIELLATKTEDQMSPEYNQATIPEEVKIDPDLSPKAKGNLKFPPSSRRQFSINPFARQAKVIQQALNLKFISAEQMQTMENHLRTDPSSVFSKIFQHFSLNPSIASSKAKQSSQSGSGQSQKQTNIFHSVKQLGFNDDIRMQNLFKSMSETETSINYARLKRSSFKEFLQGRYSSYVGEKMLLFLENQFNSLYRIDYLGFLSVVQDFLNSGPECYSKMLFTCLSLSNSGRICEHDLFTIIEQFKQRESFFFYQDLISQKDVPRDYQNVLDNSDDIFFSAFVSDIKRITRILNLKKRMFGIVDMDTVSGIEADFDEETYPGTKQEYEEDLIVQIEYIIQTILKRGGQSFWNETFEILKDAPDLKSLRNNLSSLARVRYQRGPTLEQAPKKQSTLSLGSETKSRAREASTDKEPEGLMDHSRHQLNENFFKQPQNLNLCLGAQNSTRNKKEKCECIYMTFEEFSKLMNFKRITGKTYISSLINDLIKTITLGQIDLPIFEKQMSQYRELHSGGFQGTLINGKKPSKAKENAEAMKREAAGPFKKQRGSDFGGSTEGDGLEVKQFKKNHFITEPFSVQDHYITGEFSGKVLVRNKAEEKKRKKLNAMLTLNEVQTNVSQDGDMDGETESMTNQATESNMIFIGAEQVRELRAFKEHFGIENFYNIFRCFYLLAEIPKDAENNVFALYMDQVSVVQGFEAAFGVKFEEIAIRFFSLFIEPDGKPKKFKIDIIRFYFVVQLISSLDDQRQAELAFRFYDYDNNGHIGSVDIVNLYKYMPGIKIESIFKKQVQLYKDRARRNYKYGDTLKVDDAHKTKLSSTQLFNSDESFDSDSVASEAEPCSDLDTYESADDQQSNYTKSNPTIQHTIIHASISQSQKADDKSQTVASKKGSLTQVRPEVENHMKSKKVTNAWNKALFEIKMVRDYYVNEAVVPKNKIVATDSAFLNMKRFETKFLPGMGLRYQVETPAIIHFFRDRFIRNRSSDGKLYGAQMFMQDGGTPQMAVAYSSKLNSSTLEIPDLQKALDLPATGTAPFFEMVKTLHTLSQVPKFSALQKYSVQQHEAEQAAYS